MFIDRQVLHECRHLAQIIRPPKLPCLPGIAHPDASRHTSRIIPGSPASRPLLLRRPHTSAPFTRATPSTPPRADPSNTPSAPSRRTQPPALPRLPVPSRRPDLLPLRKRDGRVPLDVRTRARAAVTLRSAAPVAGALSPRPLRRNEAPPCARRDAAHRAGSRGRRGARPCVPRARRGHGRRDACRARGADRAGAGAGRWCGARREELGERVGGVA